MAINHVYKKCFVFISYLLTQLIEDLYFISINGEGKTTRIVKKVNSLLIQCIYQFLHIFLNIEYIE